MENYLKAELYKLVKEDDTIFNFIQESSLDGLWYWDLEKPENEWMNDQFWTTLGYNPGEFPHKSDAWQNIIFQDDLKLALDNFHKHVENPNHPYDQVVRYRHKDGKTIWIRCRGLAIRDKTGNPIRMIGAHHDITALKEVEEFLKKSEEKYRLIVRSTSDVIWVYNVTQQKFTYISPSVYNLRGYTDEEALQLRFDETLTPDSAKKAIDLLDAQVQEFIKTKNEKKCYLYEFQQPHKKGGTVWIEASARYRYNDEREIEAVGISRNISERKKMEQQLKDSETRYRTLYEKSLEPIAIIKGEVFVDCNQSFLDVLKIDSKSKLINQAPWNLSPEFQPDGTPSKQKAKVLLDLAYLKGYNEFEWVFVDSDRTPHWLHTSLAKIEIKSESLLFAIYRDITRQKNFEHKLKMAQKKTEESEQRFKKLFFLSSTAVLLLDDTGTIIDCNNAALTLFRYSKEGLIHKKPWMLSPEYQPNGIRSQDSDTFEKIIGKGLIQQQNFNWSHQDANGIVFYAEVNLSPITLSNKKHIYAYIRDASCENLLQKSEAELKKANEDKNRFFSVLAHDLSAIIGNSQLLVQLLRDNTTSPEDKPQLTHYLYENTAKTYSLLADLIKWGKATMNREAFVPVELNLFELIHNIHDFYLIQFSQKNIDFQVDCPKTLQLWADKDMMETILRNLIGNALKFTPKDGYIKCNGYSNTKSLTLQIVDSGVGIEKEKAEKLFFLENIESTQGTSGENGSGLGLQIVKEYVNLHRGQISVESEIGKGTVFHLTFPINRQSLE